MSLVHSFKRSRWAALGAAVAVSLGAGGLMTASADVSSGDRPVLITITPCRVVDTRPAPDNVGARNGALGPGETYTFNVRGTNGNCTIPTDALGVVFNIAAVFPTASSFFTLFPADATRPLSANLNFVANQPPVSNAVTVKLSTSGATPGQVSIYNLAGTVHFTADIVGYFVGHNHDDRYYTETELDARQWGTANIADGAITTAKLADNSVTSAKVVDGTLATADLADNSVTSAKIVNATIATADLADGSVNSAKVLDDTAAGGGLAAVDLQANSVGASEIQTDAVNATEIADNSIDSGEIVDFGLTNQDVGVLFAQVNADGTLANFHGGAPVATSLRLGAGTYEVDFSRNITACAFIATQGEAAAGGAAGAIVGVTDRAGNAEAVFVTTRTDAGALADRAFQLVVVC